jgi:Dyp-type peroxidase family
MPIVERFATPANLPDLDSMPGELQQWHKAINYWFDSSIKSHGARVRPGPFQFYNPARFDPGGLVVEQAITWNAFPKELLRRYGRMRALEKADELWPLNQYQSVLSGIPVDRRRSPALFEHFFRPQTEYCEWRVERDRRGGKIRRVTFTSEPPELWFALFGDRLPFDNEEPQAYRFQGDRKAVAAKYEEFLRRQIRLRDLIARQDLAFPGFPPLAKKGQYNVYNKWNTTDGIVHLCAPPNFLVGEIELAASGAILRKNRAGHLLVEAEALICCAQFGGPNRNSDPTIGAAVNAAARLGAFVTLKDPVGIYMDHIDLSGWECRDKKSVADCVRIVRGSPGMIERLEIEVPSDRGLTVSDISIGGEPIRFGGQIAECITVKLTGLANLPKQPVRNDPIQCEGHCVFNSRNSHALLQLASSGDRLEPGFVKAFSSQGVEEGCQVRRAIRVLEPVLPMAEIQGIVVPGFFKPHQTMIGLRFPPGRAAILRVKAYLRTVARDVSSAKATLDDRRDYRAFAAGLKPEPDPLSSVLQAIALSFPGLRKLGIKPEAIPSAAFRLGMAARSAFLGDPRTGQGSPNEWRVGGPSTELDALLIVAGNKRHTVSRRAAELSDGARQGGLVIVYSEEGDVRSDLPGHEHFGFNDGISQPGIRGRASHKANDFITERYIAPRQLPESLLFGFPGQDLVWPGAFVLGQAGASHDPLIAGPPILAVPRWTANGSFLVFRRLVQDVGLFWRTMRALARELSTRPGFETIDEDWLAARLMGRWPSGAPVNRAPDRDSRALGENREANNHFRFDSNCRKLDLLSKYEDTFAMSKADPAGIACPWAAHIRKNNTRDSAASTGGRDSTYRRRLLRVGVPFGPPLRDRFATAEEDPDFGNRGLLFVSIQASIEDQFEFLTARWMGDPSRPRMPSGHDIVVGQNDAHNECRQRRCVIFGADGQQAEIRTAEQWIIPTGGGYFFVPSISVLRDVLAR